MGGRSSLVADPLDAQSYNRYGYVLNRSLLFTDPTGYGPRNIGGSDFGGNPQNLPRSCVDGNDCYRFIVVADPDGASSLDQWNRTLQWFESQNGPGQGGPGVGTNHPYSAGGVRHGTDAAQPGGSPSFTIAVTEDMCAEIAACSGGQSKRGPVYIWHADIDEGARITLDIGTDFIPGVAQAKTAYDALTRIQNGEDPVDVLMAAGGDAVLGLIPGLEASKKVAKALDTGEDVADAEPNAMWPLDAGSPRSPTLVADLAGITRTSRDRPPPVAGIVRALNHRLIAGASHPQARCDRTTPSGPE